MFNNCCEDTMDNLRIKGNWNVMKGQIKKQWGNLTDDDLTYREGHEDELIGRIQSKTGRSRDEIVNYINRINQ
jgi:uncharacterized protein YjbJ (UPF0337 family)